MSNEEALQILSERDRIRVNIINANDAETTKYNNDSVEALSMAISALKAEPSEDCVSREAVKSALCELCGDKNSCPFVNGDCDDLNTINALPSVTPKQKTGIDTVLDKIKAEIVELQKEYQEYGWAYDDALEIIDKYRKGERE